ncbi:hypothetical protein A3D84_05590 [Candidatus Woesebacteria bacterium RIFCSPHIGHO2_02_FULL_42_20]|uniref:Glycosyltransferase RgtA/B/C/D-like domain-containing protein n=1 Tax=Candidatus Woesebacteria bacterium RIFCSPHIGHO2_12_FULL_41_24 TaxID=1802510 RepID=A0A1F8ARZ3_9BACT|nr:MAG: hypothetical protein A2873_00255 [Candidatus Woesebacteria bacterium RIFCSPHIGHO2_01_FULL_42_80]OGM35516.1 MAG: hypothetical protein A3D84_05590 [Candidatus Woesebacteria bacterium RIFCSPHIGHO2_02_FULL_42_20]OGM54279.1 MAG: hypothetical protein A3E44_01980 [Candidatus Woesebacteria bacterium RIFCSPHIGHO2_12_FULL_41_24]OGM66296.1 MAG: hypothetical protein A2969_01740 [Candidatus Woesebacteria bacterium RIFCSPLOWO2_01_FULL_42_67]OGM70570.1 MAG: hypothetical protein A3I55_02275 [Candidatus
MKKILIFILIGLGNYWIWRIFETSLILGLSCIIASVGLSNYLINNKRYLLILSSALLVIIGLFQIKKFDIRSFTGTSALERDFIDKRMRLYPSPRVAHWLEQRPEAIAFYRFTDNSGEVLDFNYYFFANHPRERAAVTEYAKFPWFYLPPFLGGLYLSLKQKRNLKFHLLFMFAVVVTAAVYPNEPVGFVLVFPFVVSLSAYSVNNYVK